MSEVKVNKISPRSGTDVTVGGKLITESNGDLNLYPNGTGAVEIGGNTNPGTVILNCENNSHGIKLQSPPHSANQSYTLKFPSGNVTAGKFLKVDSVSGSGTTGVGTMTFADAGGGKVLQVLSMTNNGEQTISSSTNTFNDSALTLAITPSATTSKILIMYSMSNSQMTTSGYVHSTIKQAISGGSDVNLGGTYGFAVNGTDNGANHIGNHGVQYLDSPSTTNAITYTIQTRSSGSSQTYRRFRDSTYGTLTLIEIGA